MTLCRFLRCYMPIFTIWGFFGPKMPICSPYLVTSVIYLNLHDVKMSHSVVWLDSYMVYINFFAVLMSSIAIFTFWGTFGLKIPPFWAQSTYQCYHHHILSRQHIKICFSIDRCVSYMNWDWLIAIFRIYMLRYIFAFLDQFWFSQFWTWSA